MGCVHIATHFTLQVRVTAPTLSIRDGPCAVLTLDRSWAPSGRVLWGTGLNRAT